jgi:hydrogenase maturation protein HypF
MTANTPLHDLLLAAAGVPLVMTSGNLSEEPIVTDNADALVRLRGIADLFLLHDREIVTRCDDSVARVINGSPVVLRRARGYVPRPIAIRQRFEAPVLACGAQLKNTFCIGRGPEAVLGPHIGDLDSASVYRDYQMSIERLAQFLEVTPDIVAHDLHPDYLSTRYAHGRGAAVTIGVQHHHAHIASVMAEHGLDGAVIGLAYDGTGLGTDGTAWGSELMIAGYAEFTRVATFRPLPLPGGMPRSGSRGESRSRFWTTRSKGKRRSTSSPVSTHISSRSRHRRSHAPPGLQCAARTRPRPLLRRVRRVAARQAARRV